MYNLIPLMHYLKTIGWIKGFHHNKKKLEQHARKFCKKNGIAIDFKEVPEIYKKWEKELKNA